MKRSILFLLCLTLLLTLALPVCAEDTLTQPPVQTEAPRETEAPKETEAPTQPPQSTEAPQPTEHTHSWVKVLVPSTCVEQGGTVVMCSVCEAVDSVELLPLADHTYDNACDPECNICGHTREAAHTFAVGWTYNSRKHWHACTLCGAKDEERDHYPGPAATEDRDQYCLTCGLLMTKRLAHTHKYADTWTFDETGHWRICQSCGEKKDVADHSYDNACDPDCNICGYTSATEHSFGEGYASGERGHWQVCGLCEEATLIQDHVPGDGGLACSICGWKLVEPQEHVHTFQEQWLGDGLDHWKACDCGEVSEKAAHHWQEAGTDREKDLRQEKCTVCEAQRTQPLPAAEFPWGILLTVLVVLLVVCVVALILVIRRGL